MPFSTQFSPDDMRQIPIFSATYHKGKTYADQFLAAKAPVEKYNILMEVKARVVEDDKSVLKRLWHTVFSTNNRDQALNNITKAVYEEMVEKYRVDGALGKKNPPTTELTPDEFITRLKEGGNFGDDLIVVTGDVSLTFKSHSLPRNMLIIGNVYLYGTAAPLLPEGLSVVGNLNARHTPLTSLPEGLSVGGNLDLSATLLTSLPNGLSLGGDLDLSFTPLTSLPNGLSVGGNLDLSFTSLTSLPEGLSVGGNLDLGTTLLTSLPEGLSVGGSLDLRGTPLTSLPEGLSLGGNLFLSSRTGLTALPNWITTLGPNSDGSIRHVFLDGTGLSDALIDRLMEAPTPGMRFYFSRYAPPVEVKWNTLAAAFEAWSNPLPEEERPTLSLSLEGTELTKMLDFLSRLQETAEYKNSAARPVLARRIVDVLKSMEEDKDSYRERANDTIHHGLATCHDRIIVALDTLDLMNIVKKAEESGRREELEELGKSLLMLERVHDKARLHATTLEWVDEIEILLAFQIGLRDRLNLPLATGNMIFRRCAYASDKQIQAAGDAIVREVKQADVDKFLAEWEPWQKMLRREAFPQKEGIKQGNGSQITDWSCSITIEDITEGVLLNGNVYDYEAFKSAYIEKPVDPLSRKPIDLSQLRYVRTPSQLAE